MPLKKTLADLANEAKSKIHEVDVDELGEGEHAEAMIIDVREPNERARGFIPGSLSIPRGVLERDIEKIAFGRMASDADLRTPIVCYCGGGARSALAALTLQTMGFANVASLRGGFKAWGDAGRPVDLQRASAEG